MTLAFNGRAQGQQHTGIIVTRVTSVVQQTGYGYLHILLSITSKPLLVLDVECLSWILLQILPFVRAPWRMVIHLCVVMIGLHISCISADGLVSYNKFVFKCVELLTHE